MRSKIIAFPGIKGSCDFNNCVMRVLRVDLMQCVIIHCVLIIVRSD